MAPVLHKSLEIHMAKAPLSKSAFLQVLADRNSGLTRKDVKGVVESIVAIGYQELKKTGVFVVPGLVKLLVVKKPATKARKGINPFTKEEMMFKAKPASKKIRLAPLKSLKALVN
jgi:DNA-binding protein HU-beta